MAGFVSSKLDEVSRNSIWEESIRKENKVLKLNSNFAIGDPRKMTILTEKPNQIKHTANPDQETMAMATTTLMEMSYIKDYDKLPTERFALPITSNMQYGFASRTIVPQNSQFDHKKQEYDVTKYANAYVKMSGTSPYAQRDFSGSLGKQK